MVELKALKGEANLQVKHPNIKVICNILFYRFLIFIFYLGMGADQRRFANTEGCGVRGVALK